MTQYFAGLDGGGTKTALCVLSPEGRVIAEGVFGPMNPNSVPEKALCATMGEALKFMGETGGGLGGCLGLCIASAGISNPDACALLLEGARQGGYGGRTLLKGDHEAALAGALSGRDGAVLVAGTGSVCVGKRRRRLVRSGGYGHLIDDEGSGYALGRDMLSAVVRGEDGRAGPTLLKALVYEALHIETVQGIIRFTYGEGTTKKEIAALARLLDVALQQGDQAAQAIADKAAGELALLAETVLRQIEARELAFLGSILTKSAAVAGGTAARLKKSLPGLKILEPEHHAAFGAALLAKTEAGVLR